MTPLARLAAAVARHMQVFYLIESEPSPTAAMDLVAGSAATLEGDLRAARDALAAERPCPATPERPILAALSLEEARMVGSVFAKPIAFLGACSGPDCDLCRAAAAAEKARAGVVERLRAAVTEHGIAEANRFANAASAAPEASR